MHWNVRCNLVLYRRTANTHVWIVANCIRRWERQKKTKRNETRYWKRVLERNIMTMHWPMKLTPYCRSAFAYCDKWHTYFYTYTYSLDWRICAIRPHYNCTFVGRGRSCHLIAEPSFPPINITHQSPFILSHIIIIIFPVFHARSIFRHLPMPETVLNGAN